MSYRLRSHTHGRRLLVFSISLATAAFWHAAFASRAVSAAVDETGFVALTGPDAQQQWIGYGLDEAKSSWPDNWEFSGGVLHAKGPGPDLKSREDYGTFDLRFKFKVNAGGNSGVLFHVSQEKDPPYYTGPEYQIYDETGHDNVPANTVTGALYDLYTPTKKPAKGPGEWNDGRILVVGNHVEFYLNGEKIVECEMGSYDWNKRVAGSKFAAWKKFGLNKRGRVDLQSHGDEVWFRDVRIKNLDKEKPAQ